MRKELKTKNKAVNAKTKATLILIAIILYSFVSKAQTTCNWEKECTSAIHCQEFTMVDK